MKQVSFTRMDEGTKEDYELLAAEEASVIAAFPERVLSWLREMDRPGPYAVTRLEHSLQAATRALHAGEQEEMVVGALLHDIGDVIAPANHSEVAAALLRPYVSARICWIVHHHGLFQGYYYSHHYGEDPRARDRFSGHDWYEDTVKFCAEYDQISFDPAYPSESLEVFEPMVRRVFAEPRYER